VVGRARAISEQWRAEFVSVSEPWRAGIVSVRAEPVEALFWRFSPFGLSLSKPKRETPLQYSRTASPAPVPKRLPHKPNEAQYLLDS
jgi:hypothetical protein